MRSKHLLLFAIILLSFASCKMGNNRFTVMGEIKDMPKQKVVLEELAVNDVITIIDSTSSDDNGKFELSGSAPEPGLYRIHFQQNKYILLAIEKGNLKVTGDWAAIQEYRVDGSPASAS